MPPPLFFFLSSAFLLASSAIFFNQSSALCPNPKRVAIGPGYIGGSSVPLRIGSLLPGGFPFILYWALPPPMYIYAVKSAIGAPPEPSSDPFTIPWYCGVSPNELFGQYESMKGLKILKGVQYFTGLNNSGCVLKVTPPKLPVVVVNPLALR